jgi:hypothetical protein
LVWILNLKQTKTSIFKFKKAEIPNPFDWV